jgi:hypothetical protein
VGLQLVIPAKAGIQLFDAINDGSKTGFQLSLE